VAEADPLFPDFKVTDGEGEERSIVLVAKTPEEKQKLAAELANSEESTKPTSDFHANRKCEGAKCWSGRRESNPRMKLGKLPFYH
jgi:hypothetical protein